VTLLVQLIKWEITFFLLGLIAIVAIQLLTGQIKMAGLLHGEISGRPRGHDEYFSPERVQMLVFTIGAALYYLSLVLANPNPGKFPDVPTTWPAILGGSNTVYLGGKVWARWFAGNQKTNQIDRRLP
jgi:hypothetical protein